MTNNKPKVVAWKWRKPVVNDHGETVGGTCKLGEAPGVPLVCLSDYKALQAECEELRAELNLWSPIHDEVIRRAEKQHCLQDRCDFEVTVMYEDYAAIQDPNHENQ